MKIGLLGAGHMAQTLAAPWAAAGHDILLTNSRGADSLGELVAELGEQVHAAEPMELPVLADVIVLATPFGRVGAAIERMGPIDGKVVVDTTNNLGEGAADLGDRVSSEVVADLLPGARLVKAFNTYPIDWLGTLHEFDEPRVIFVSGNDEAAKNVVGELVRDLGGEPLDLGGLVEGSHRLIKGSPLTGHGRMLSISEARALSEKPFD